MSHVEFLENLYNLYKDDFEKWPADDDETVAFRSGMLYAFRVAIIKLKNGEEL